MKAFFLKQKSCKNNYSNVHLQTEVCINDKTGETSKGRNSPEIPANRHNHQSQSAASAQLYVLPQMQKF